MANQSQSPLPPLATAAAAAAREVVRLWDREWATPGSVDVGLEEGLGLEVCNKKVLPQVGYKLKNRERWKMKT